MCKHCFSPYLLHVCMRRMITTISSDPDPSLPGAYGLSGNAQRNAPPRVKGGHTAQYSHVGDGTVSETAAA